MKAYDPIPMPTDAEKSQAISQIIVASDMPSGRLHNPFAVAKEFSFSVLFFGLGDCIFLAVLLALLFAILCVVPTSLAATGQSPIVPMLFLLSPALYAALHLLTWWKESMTRTLEWKQTCKLSFGMMTALRMLVFGGGATLLCVPQCFLMWLVIGERLSFLWMLSVSFASLFLYAALTLSFRKSRWGMFTPPACWLAIGILMLFWEKAALLLLEVPTIVFILLAAVALAATLVQLMSLSSQPYERGFNYAVR